MRVLVLCDDRWHPAATPRAGLEALGACGFEFDWQENAEDWSAEQLADYPLVILTKANQVSSSDHRPWMTGAVEAALRAYVQKGNGLLVIHSGTAGYRETPALRDLIGGLFVQHPPQTLVTVEPEAGHALTAGSSAFTLKDEHYFMDMAEAPVDLFLSATSEHGTQPAGWTRLEGQGRIWVLTPGHNLEVWLHPSFQALLLNGLRWCSKQND